MDRPDATLLADAAAGDEDAFAAFFRRHVRAVTGYAVRRAADSDEVSEVVSETFLVALGAADRYEPMMPTALPWLYGIARRVLMRSRRRRSGAARLFHKVSNVTPRYTGSEEDAVNAAVDAARRRAELHAALDDLSAVEREVLELIAYEGLTPMEAAIVLDISPNAARLRLSRARKRMRESLAGFDLVSEVGRAF